MYESSFRRVRLFAAENFPGCDYTARDDAIRIFLRDLHTVVTERYVEHLPDNVLGELFVDWIKVAEEGEEGNLGEALLHGWPKPFLPFSRGVKAMQAMEQVHEAPPHDNVVTLHERTGRPDS